MLRLRLAHNNCDCREFYLRTVTYIVTLSQFTVTAQSEQELYMWTEHACTDPSTCARVLYVGRGPPIEIGFSTCERDNSPRQHHKIWNSHNHFHTPRQSLSNTMPCPPGHTVYNAISLQAIPYQIPCHARQAIPYSMPCRSRIERNDKGSKGLITSFTIVMSRKMIAFQESYYLLFIRGQWCIVGQQWIHVRVSVVL